MQFTRRSFLASIISAVVMAPMLCRLKQEVGIRIPEQEVTAMQSTWDGRLSPNFLRQYGLPAGTPSKKQITQSACS